MKTKIDLQDGFMGEPVIIRANGETVFASNSVQTRMQTGFACAVELDLAG